MDESPLLLWIACASGAGGVGVLRYAWALPKRAGGWNAAGWLLIAASALFGWRYGGAWGVSVAALVTTAAAFVALSVAAISAPRGRATAPLRRTGVLPQAGEPRRIGRRVTTFLLVMPGGFLASIALAVGTRGLCVSLGWGEADANVAAFFAVPLAWSVLATVLLMQAERRSQIVTLLGCAFIGAPFLLTGLGS